MLDSARTYAAVGGAVGTKRANALTYRMDNLSRVACFFIGDSNSLKDGYGLCGGLHAVMNARFGAYGTGFLGAKHTRSAGQRASGADMTWSYYGDATLSNAVRNTLAFTGASWNNGTLTLTGTFTGYTPKVGDIVTINSGTNLGAGVAGSDFFVQTGSSVGSLILDRTIGASASAVAGSIGNGPGTTSFSFMPDAFHQAWNIPLEWLPLGATGVYHASGSHGLSCSLQALPKWGPLSCNSRLQVTLHQLLVSGGGTGSLMFGHWDGTPSSLATQTSILAQAFSSAGTSGVLSQVRRALTAGDRVASSYGSKEFFICGTGQTALDVGPNYYLGTSIEDLDATTGVSMSAFLCKGGHSAWDMAKIARDVLTDDTIENFLAVLNDSVSASTGGAGVLHAVGFIHTGFNDHAEGNTSLGTGAVISSSKAGYKDNLIVMMDRMKAIFDAMIAATTLNAASTLTFILIPSHPISDSPTTPGTGSYAAREGYSQLYREAAYELMLERQDVIPVDLFTLLGPTPFSALYNRKLTYAHTGVPASDDVLHLTPGGYRWLAGKIVSALDYAGPRGNYLGPNRRSGGG